MPFPILALALVALWVVADTSAKKEETAEKIEDSPLPETTENDTTGTIEVQNQP